MSALPEALREHLDAPQLNTYSITKIAPTDRIRADRARAMAAALRWAKLDGEYDTVAEYDAVIAALDAEATK